MFLWSRKVQNTRTAVANITVKRIFCLIGNGEAGQVALVGERKEMPSGPSARSRRAAAP